MQSQSAQNAVINAMERINRAWLERRPDELVPLFHPDSTLVFPGFAGRAKGRDEIVAGFKDFCLNSTVHDYREAERSADVMGDTAVVSFRYEMVYENGGQKNRATGRDVWVFSRIEGHWLAVWRTMLDLVEQPV